MTAGRFLELVLGPTGALVCLAVGAWVLWGSVRRAEAGLARLYESELIRLRKERDDLARRLEREHQARLDDARQSTHELQETWRTVVEVEKSLQRRLSERPPPTSMTPTGTTSPRPRS